MKRFDFSRLLFNFVSVTTVLGVFFAIGLYSGAKKNFMYDLVHSAKTALVEALRVTSREATTITKLRPEHFLQPARYPGAGVIINEMPDDGSLIFMSGFFEDTNELRLVRRDGTVVVRWPVRYYDIFPNPTHVQVAPATNWNVDTHGALALPDGSIVFNFEYDGLVKLDRCGKVVWTLAERSHHSVERAEGGGFWVPGQHAYPVDTESPFPPFVTPFDADTIMRVSEDGKLLYEFSVPQLFYDNGMEAVLTSTGEIFHNKLRWDHEIVHLNKIAELPSAIAADFPMFEAGDLALSIRNLNLVMVIDPKTRSVKWWREGPWLRQHDVEFKAGGKLVLFNNNSYVTAFGDNFEHHAFDISPVTAPRISNIMEYNPATSESRILYGGTKEQELLSIIQGKVQLTRDGGLLITEFETGRVLEADATGHVVWEYINRYDSDHIAEITEAVIYPADYFNVVDWSCN